MIHCLICRQTSQCYKCQIQELKQENTALRNELARFHTIENDALQLKYWQSQEIINTFTQSKMKIPFEYKSKLSNAYFITITFDPNKFGVAQLEDERKQYILYSLYKCIKSELLTEVYGCFEYHKNGLVHAHAILITGYPKEIQQKLHPLYTDNTKNKVVIQIDKAKHPQAQQYIEKESTHYFHYINDIIRELNDEGKPRRPEAEDAVFKPMGVERPATKLVLSRVVGSARSDDFTCLSPKDLEIRKKYIEKSI